MLQLDAKQFYQMMLSAEKELAGKASEINNLNVFPVPDGDTGSNMNMTMKGVIGVTEDKADRIGKLSEAIASGLLRSARGNSGVILSVFFRGVSARLKEQETATAADLVEAFEKGVEAAYRSVMKPTEGTILTVMRESAEAGRKLIESQADCPVENLFRAMASSAEESLRRTPELLPTLKKAGVVDAGGYGFYTILAAMSVAGSHADTLPEVHFAPAEVITETSAAAAFDAEITYPYCTECILEKSDAYFGEGKVEDFHAFVLSAGDSAVFVDDNEIVKVHVHTSDPGRVLSEAVKYGTLLTVKVENMKKQHTELSKGAGTGKKTFADPFGFVAVASGEGICEAFRELGVNEIVIGGQTMNPSTDDLVKAIDRVDAGVVFVLPNNSNIIMVAEQAAAIVSERSGKEVTVLKTRTIPQGISAVYAFDPAASLEENRNGMENAIAGVVSLSVTYAVRDAVMDDFSIRKGQFLGLAENKVCLACDRLEDCLDGLLPTLSDANCVTIFYGEDADQEEAEALRKRLTEILGPDVDLTVADGGQPVYRYLISGEVL